MSVWSTTRSLADALGLWKRNVAPIGSELGVTIFRETKRSAQIANVGRPSRPLDAETVERLQPLFEGLDLRQVRSSSPVSPAVEQVPRARVHLRHDVRQHDLLA